MLVEQFVQCSMFMLTLGEWLGANNVCQQETRLQQVTVSVLMTGISKNTESFTVCKHAEGVI